MSALHLILLILIETQIIAAGAVLWRYRRQRAGRIRAKSRKDFKPAESAQKSASEPEAEHEDGADAFERMWRETFESMLAYDMETAKRASGGDGR